ncbi:MAG: hypothetical protein U0103_17290 [Candidatus Obscuribacterales bacterium]|nr:hypothetical protein [Cyanobacteria bacterium SZAS LIN-5]
MKWSIIKRVGIMMIALIFSGCIVSHDDVVTKYTADKKLRATVVEINGGATTPFAYEVYVNDALVARLVDARRSENGYGVNIEWDQTTSPYLKILYLKAKSARQLKSTLEINGQTVRIELIPNVYDRNAPDGGMKYNLKSNISEEAD